MAKNNSSSQSNYYSFKRRLLRGIIYFFSSIFVTILLLWIVFSALGNKPEFYIEGRKFEEVKQVVDKGNIELLSNIPASWKMIDDGIKFTVHYPEYISIDDKYKYGSKSDHNKDKILLYDNKINSIIFKISSEDAHLNVGANNMLSQRLIFDETDWRIQTRISEQTMVCTYNRTDDGNNPNICIQSSDPNISFPYSSTIQASLNVFTNIRKPQADYEKKFKCEIWINTVTDDGNPDRVIDDFNYISILCDFPIIIEGKTNEIKLDDADFSISPVNNLFDDRNYCDINISNVNQVDMLNLDGEIYQYVGENLISYKSFRENVNSKGTFNTIWSLKDGQSNLEISGNPSSITKNGNEINPDFFTWLKCNATSITLTIIAGVLGGLLEFTKTSKQEEN